MTLDGAVDLVLYAFEHGQNGDIFVQEAPACTIGVPAEALGSSVNGKPCGGLGDMGILSFNGNKIITTSGGGALLSNDPGLISRARFLSTQARDPAPHYEHTHIGYNYRMSNILAAIGKGVRCRCWKKRVKTRRQIFEHYLQELGDTPGISFLPEL